MVIVELLNIDLLLSMMVIRFGFCLMLWIILLVRLILLLSSSVSGVLESGYWFQVLSFMLLMMSVWLFEIMCMGEGVLQLNCILLGWVMQNLLLVWLLCGLNWMKLFIIVFMLEKWLVIFCVLLLVCWVLVGVVVRLSVSVMVGRIMLSGCFNLVMFVKIFRNFIFVFLNFFLFFR